MTVAPPVLSNKIRKSGIAARGLASGAKLENSFAIRAFVMRRTGFVLVLEHSV
jgi:hypothetical protein